MPIGSLEVKLAFPIVWRFLVFLGVCMLEFCNLVPGFFVGFQKSFGEMWHAFNESDMHFNQGFACMIGFWILSGFSKSFAVV